VSNLKVGMFVSGLDRDWLETPFLMQGFFIHSPEDINKVAEYCRHVYVLGTGKLDFAGEVDFESGILIGRKPEKYPLQSSVQKEHKQAKVTQKKVRKYIRGFLKSTRFGETVDTDAAKGLVSESVESVLRHPDAMSFLTKLRGQDEYTVEHCINVCMLAIVFGRRLGLRKNQLINLGLCGLLHDVGKMKVPYEILMKPGRLTQEEYEIMKQHTELGAAFLKKRKGVFQGVIDVALSHHERPDGLGYPNGLADSELALFTKIISIVDAYDAITGDRVYATGRPSTEALRILYEQRGKQFDDKLALAFIQTVGIYPPGTVVELLNQKVAVVVDASLGLRHLPRVLVVRDENKEPCEEYLVDLGESIDNPQLKPYLIRSSLSDGCYGIKLASFYERGLFEHEFKSTPPADPS
jgi:putative nucleotidyltransferase with HDIG domain